MRVGREREKRIANYLSPDDVRTIVATLEFFNVERPLLQQTAWDLTVPRYRVFDWLAMNLDREMNDERLGKHIVPDDSNIWVAQGQTYVHTSAVPQFINSLRYNDYEPWQGSFTSDKFVAYLDKWDKEDVLNERRLAEEAGRLKRD
jgi:hypothetical protein